MEAEWYKLAAGRGKGVISCTGAGSHFCTNLVSIHSGHFHSRCRKSGMATYSTAVVLASFHNVQALATAAKWLPVSCYVAVLCAGICSLQSALVSSQVFVLQFVATLTANIEKLSGSPVTVTVDSITSGSVTVATTVAFLSGDSSSASTYTSALTSGSAASIFGTSFGSVAVDTSSIKASTVANPSESKLTHCLVLGINMTTLRHAFHELGNKVHAMTGDTKHINQHCVVHTAVCILIDMLDAQKQEAAAGFN